MSLNVEDGWDNVIVEARTVGGSDWTTLPELGGATSTTPPAECEAGYLLEMHPWLERYLTLGNPCTTKGNWNALTGNSGGWQDYAFDLSAFAGKQVEVTISYVTDPGTGGVGVFVDDTALRIGGVESQQDGFEGATSTWTVQGEPEGSPENSGNWVIGPKAVNFYAGTATDDTLLLGFGLEQVPSTAERVALVRRALSGLGVR
jgi:hypothetical protein